MINLVKHVVASAQKDRIESLPRIRCGNYPTPLEEMSHLRAFLGSGCPRLFVKRDDLTGTAFGSNKLRKLDYAIAAEIDRGTEAIVTIAGERSNHARVTAAVCARLGLKCILVLNRSNKDSSPAGMIPASRYVYELLGAELRRVDSREEREDTALCAVESLIRRGVRAAYLPLGVSFPLGAVGFVRAVREVCDQFKRYDIFPDAIFHASTSGGTQAGLIVGVNSMQMKTTVIGISPDDSSSEVCNRVASIASGMVDFVDQRSCLVGPEDVIVSDSFIGGGYGVATDASTEAALVAAKTEGLILDHTYTAKAFAAMLDSIAAKKFDGSQSILLWHTGGQLAPFYAPRATR